MESRSEGRKNRVGGKGEGLGRMQGEDTEVKGADYFFLKKIPFSILHTFTEADLRYCFAFLELTIYCST